MKNAVIRCTVVALFLAALPVAAQTGAWTAVGSSGDIDEASMGIFAVNLSTLQHQPGAVGSVVARYNVTNTFGGGLTDTPPWTTMEMTYLDVPVAGSIGTVSASLFEVDRCTGAISFICSINSVDGNAPACLTCTFPSTTVINFGASHYVVEVRVFRNMNNVFPQLIGLSIF